MVRKRNADLELDKSGFRGIKENNEILTNIFERHHIFYIWMHLGVADQ